MEKPIKKFKKINFYAFTYNRRNKIKKSHFLYKINIIYNGDKMKNIKYEREKVLKYAKR